MKKKTTWLTLLSAVFVLSLTGTAMAEQLSASQSQITTTSPAPNVTLHQINYQGSDSPSVDDPLGNSPMTPKDDAGPPDTRNFAVYCSTGGCNRAETRWVSNTNWRQDRAAGLSLGWGGQR